MKNYLTLFAAACLALSNLSAFAGPLLESYWPLNDGDQKTFLYDNNLPLTMTVTGEGSNLQGQAQFEISETYKSGGATMVFAEDGTNCFFISIPGWIKVSADPPVLLLDDDILQTGGTVKTSTMIQQTGISSYPATFTITVANAGSITVPGGTFANCRSITSTEVAKVPGKGTITAKALTAYLAPGVGIIKTLVATGKWAELVNGTVGGVAVGDASFTSLTLITNGLGTVTPSINGEWFPSGQSLSFTAAPKSGQIFFNWTDGSNNILGTTLKLAYAMRSNLVVQANFIPNPFAPVTGNYNGLVLPVTGITPQNSGFFSTSVTGKGAFSAKLRFPASSVSFNGQFDGSGNFSKIIGDSLTVTLSANLGYDNGQITGYVTGQGWTSDIIANQSFFTSKNPAPQSGKYTMVFAGVTNSPTRPGGDGYGTVTINNVGSIALSGVLADGTTITQTAVLSEGGMWPFYVSLYGGQGSILGWLTVNRSSSPAIAGLTFWTKPEISTAKLYPSGFDFTNSVTGYSYTPPGKDQNVFSFSQGNVVLSGGDLASIITNSISIGSRDKVTDLSNNKLTLSFKPASGLFQGTVVDPSMPDAKPIPFGGVVLQSQNDALGFFSLTGQSGPVLIEQSP